MAVAGHTGRADVARRGLADTDPKVRCTALGALSRLGSLTPEDLEAASVDPEETVRGRAAELCALVDAEAVAAETVTGLLLKALEDPSPNVTEAACFALGELGDRAAPAVAKLSRVARDHRDPLCREAAVAALGAIGDEAGLEAILAATADKPAVRRRAVIALAPFSGEDVEAALDRAMQDRDWQVRQAAEDLTGRTE